MVHEVYITVGSNIAPEQNLRACLELLSATYQVVSISPVYETAPVGSTEQAPFLNAAVNIQTDQDPASVKTTLLRIETTLGRVRDPGNKNAPRTIDLDIALWDDAILTYGSKPWRAPDPDILRFIHLARPLADLAPTYPHPETGETLESIAGRLDQGGMRRRVDFDWRQE
jgi:2-amino-4-hydroxy-6-hydroxymethyldihydropteridine diphosphokinase